MSSVPSGTENPKRWVPVPKIPGTGTKNAICWYRIGTENRVGLGKSIPVPGTICSSLVCYLLVNLFCLFLGNWELTVCSEMSMCKLV
ncbi:hypothetical protein Hanom_Chr03g00189781 [Helianthus anomalus]